MPVSKSATLRQWLLTNIAFPLNDAEPNHEFTRYPLRTVLSFLNDGLAMVAKYRPDLFTRYLVVKLQPGVHQDMSNCTHLVLDVMEQVDANGNIIKQINGSRKTNTTAKKKWNKPSCITPSGATGYVLTSADIDANMNGMFDVNPPVPCDEEVYVRLKAVVPPCRYTEADLETPFDHSTTQALAVKHYILEWLMLGDRFSNAGTVQQAQWHHTQFFGVLGVLQQQEQREESPATAGEQSDNYATYYRKAYQ